MRFVYSDRSKPEIIEGMCRWVGPLVGDSYDPARASGISVLCEHGAATVLYTDFTPLTDVRMHIAGTGHWASREFFARIFGLPFQGWGVRRATALVAKKNRKSRALVERLGFMYEGCAREGAPNGEHLILYGMLRRECRWLKEEMDHVEGLGTVAA